MINLVPSYIEALQSRQFHKLIIGAALKDYQSITDLAYLFTYAKANVIDISAFPLSVISAKQGVEKALVENKNLVAPLIMVSVNVDQDPHFRRVELDLDTCTECLACIPTCPSEAFSYESAQFRYDINLCFGCANCLEDCPVTALELKQWSTFDPAALVELQQLGANAIELHLNHNLDAFSEFYKQFNLKFELESFCIGSEPLTEQQLEESVISIVEHFTNKYGVEQSFIIQTDGIPMSGARDLGANKDLTSMQNANLVINYLSKYYPERNNIFVQLAGGIDEKSLARAHELGILVNGVAIGSYARKKILQQDGLAEKIKVAVELLEASKTKLGTLD